MAATPQKRELVEQFAPFVRSIARQIKKSVSPRIELEDLVGYGMTGLLEAADRYDASHGANFSTFSYYRIRGAIYDGLRGMGWVSRTEYQKIRFGERATAYLENASHKDPQSVEDLANQVNQLVTIFVTSLEGMVDQEFEDKSSMRQDDRMEHEQLRKMMKEALLKLPVQDQELIQLYYFRDLSLEEVGQKIGLSKSWTCRRHAQVVDKLGTLIRNMMSPLPQHSSKLRFA